MQKGKPKRYEHNNVSKQLKNTFFSSLSILVGICIFLLVFILSITFINKSVFELYGSGQGEVGSFQLKFSTLHSELRYLVYDTTTENQSDSIEKINSIMEELMQDAKSLETIMIEKESKDIYDGAIKLFEEYIPIKDNIISYEKEQGKYNSEKLYANEGSSIANQFEDSISRLFVYMSERGTTYSNLFVVISIIIAFIALVTGCFLVLFAIKRMKKTIIAICEPLEILTLNSKEIAQGNLHVQINKDGGNEIGVLAQSLAYTVDSLNIYVLDISDKLQNIVEYDLTTEITQEYAGDFLPIRDSLVKILEFLNIVFKQIETASTEVYAGATQVAEGAQSLAEGASSQNTVIQEISEEILTISTNAKLNKNLCEKADSISKFAKSSAEIGKNKMNHMVSTMIKIDETSNQISKVLLRINDIAEQTNLLALNAQIEAARAGDAGKGFSVVANEVANLADRCTAASKETEKMIMETLEAVSLGNIESKETAEALKDTVENIDIVVDTMNQILEATKNQQEAIEHVSDDIKNISDIVYSNSATAEESAAASEQLSAQSEVLREILHNIKLK